MRDRNGLERLMEAKKYQKMALMALLPERAAEHMEVIEDELSAMFKECMFDFMFDAMSRFGREEASDREDSFHDSDRSMFSKKECDAETGQSGKATSVHSNRAETGQSRKATSVHTRKITIE